MGSFPSQNSAANRYDALRNRWTSVPVTRDSNNQRKLDAGVGRGLTVDASGTVWVAQHGDNGGRLTGFNGDTLAPILDVLLTPGGRIPIGVGVGSGGKIWTNNQATANVSVVDPATGTVAFFPVGGYPYTYSDFTGSILRTFTAPTGTYSEIENACYGFPVSQWFDLQWTGLTPVGSKNGVADVTKLRFRMRVANQLVTKDAGGNPVDPATATNWSYYFPDDINNPAGNPLDPNRVYFYDLLPAGKLPSSGPCQGVQQNVYNAGNNAYSVTGCADLSAFPQTYNNGSGQVTINYVQVQATLVSDGDNTVHPTLNGFKLVRSCPQY